MSATRTPRDLGYVNIITCHTTPFDLFAIEATLSPHYTRAKFKSLSESIDSFNSAIDDPPLFAEYYPSRVGNPRGIRSNCVERGDGGGVAATATTTTTTTTRTTRTTTTTTTTGDGWWMRGWLGTNWNRAQQGWRVSAKSRERDDDAGIR